MIYGLDLFSGIGGISLALKPWIIPIAYCEIDPYCQGVLLSRMQEGALHEAPIWDDVRTFSAEAIENCDIIYGGFPCQDISVAGMGKGLEGKRSGLFFEIVRLAEGIRPEFLFLENVPAIRTRGLAQIAKEFARLGYDCRWDLISAEEMGAPHLRQRWFFLAKLSDTESMQRKTFERNESKRILQNVCDADRDELRKQSRRIGRKSGKNSTQPFEPGWWASESSLDRVAHGVSFRVDRLRGLGNSVVPAQAREAFKRLMGL